MQATLFKSHIAQQLRALRKQRAMSLDTAATLTGVSKAMLGQIEREESSPTIATLWKIASGLEVSFSSFFATEPTLCSEQASFPNDPNMQVNTLFAYAVDTRMEVFEITLLHGHQQLSAPHTQGVIEHVHVLDGELAVLYEGQWHPLQAGECVRFYADQPHGYRAISETAKFHNIVRYL